jgi:ATP synthase protein I
MHILAKIYILELRLVQKIYILGQTLQGAFLLSKSLKVQAFYLMFWQLLVIIGLAVLLLVQSVQSAFSVLLGGLCYWLPTCWFAWRIFAHTGARAAKQFVAAFFVGEMIKLFLSGVLFLLIVKYLPVNVVSMLIGFVAAIIAFWVVCGVGLEGKKGIK